MSIDSILGSSLQQALFQYADKNRDGGLDTSELKTVAGALLGSAAGSAAPTDDQVAALETQLDGNQDGKVDEGEFLQASVAQANTASLLDGGTFAAMLGTGVFGNSSNPYSALPGFSGGTDISNLYSSLIGNTLSASNGSTADLTGELVAGALSTKGILA
jgi:hypothetical protein